MAGAGERDVGQPAFLGHLVVAALLPEQSQHVGQLGLALDRLDPPVRQPGGVTAHRERHRSQRRQPPVAQLRRPPGMPGRERALDQPGDGHRVPLQALGRVHRQDLDGVLRLDDAGLQARAPRSSAAVSQARNAAQAPVALANPAATSTKASRWARAAAGPTAGPGRDLDVEQQGPLDLEHQVGQPRPVRPRSRRSSPDSRSSRCRPRRDSPSATGAGPRRRRRSSSASTRLTLVEPSSRRARRPPWRPPAPVAGAHRPARRRALLHGSRAGRAPGPGAQRVQVARARSASAAPVSSRTSESPRVGSCSTRACPTVDHLGHVQQATQADHLDRHPARAAARPRPAGTATACGRAPRRWPRRPKRLRSAMVATADRARPLAGPRRTRPAQATCPAPASRAGLQGGHVDVAAGRGPRAPDGAVGARPGWRPPSTARSLRQLVDSWAGAAGSPLARREVVREPLQVAGASAAPAVDRLARVADRGDRVAAAEQRLAAAPAGRGWCPGTRRAAPPGTGSRSPAPTSGARGAIRAASATWSPKSITSQLALALERRRATSGSSGGRAASLPITLLDRRAGPPGHARRASGRQLEQPVEHSRQGGVDVVRDPTRCSATRRPGPARRRPRWPGPSSTSVMSPSQAGDQLGRPAARQPASLSSRAPGSSPSRRAWSATIEAA